MPTVVRGAWVRGFPETYLPMWASGPRIESLGARTTRPETETRIVAAPCLPSGLRSHDGWVRVSTMPAQMATSETARLATLPTPHGTGAGYNSGCRCESCRGANAARARAKRARRRFLGATQASEHRPPPDSHTQRPAAEVARYWDRRASSPGTELPAGPALAADPSAAPASPAPASSGGTLALVVVVLFLILGVIALALRRGGPGPPLRPPAPPWRPRF